VFPAASVAVAVMAWPWRDQAREGEGEGRHTRRPGGDMVVVRTVLPLPKPAAIAGGLRKNPT